MSAKPQQKTITIIGALSSSPNASLSKEDRKLLIDRLYDGFLVPNNLLTLTVKNRLDCRLTIADRRTLEQKFNEDQPRDDHGRFASVEGGEQTQNTAQTAPHPPGFNANPNNADLGVHNTPVIREGDVFISALTDKVPFVGDSAVSQILNAADAIDKDWRYGLTPREDITVSVSTLRSLQPYVTEATVENYRGTVRDGDSVRRPVAIEDNGKYYITNGTHRAIAQVLEGETKIPITVVVRISGKKLDGGNKSRNFFHELLNLKQRRERNPLLTKVESIIDLKALENAFDKGEQDLIDQLKKLRQKLLDDALEGIIELSPADYHTLVVDPPAASRAAFRDELERIYDEGRKLVLDELVAQGGTGLGELRDLDDDDLDYLDEVSDLTVSKVANDVQSRVIGLAGSLALLGLAGAALQGRLSDEFEDSSTAYLDSTAAGANHAVMGIGRSTAAEDLSDAIGNVYYSCVLDENSCSPCEEADGETGATDADITPAPNPDCDGGTRCRCIHLYVLADEEKPLKANPNHDDRGRFAESDSGPQDVNQLNPAGDDLIKVLAERGLPEVSKTLDGQTFQGVKLDKDTYFYHGSKQERGVLKPQKIFNDSGKESRVVNLGDKETAIGWATVRGGSGFVHQILLTAGTEIYQGMDEANHVVVFHELTVEKSVKVESEWATPEDLRFKFNESHDEQGRFSSGDGGTAKSFTSDADGKAFIDKTYGDWKKSLTSKEDAAFAFYQSPGYELMNGQARGLKVDAPAADLKRAKQAIKDLDSAIEKSPGLPHDLVVHRGLNAEQFGAVKEGDILTDKGFTSVSLTAGSGTGGKDQATATIRLPQGIKVAAGRTKELVLPRNTQFKVTSYKKVGRKVSYELEVI